MASNWRYVQVESLPAAFRRIIGGARIGTGVFHAHPASVLGKGSPWSVGVPALERTQADWAHCGE